MTYPSAVLADSPRAYYRLGDASGSTVLTDSSGNARHGTMNSSSVSATGLLVGDTNLAHTFDGSDTVEVADGSWMDVTTIAIDCLFKATSSPASKHLVCRDDGSGDAVNSRMFQLRFDASSRLQFTFFDSTGTVRSVTGSTVVSVGTRYHAGVEFNGTNAYLYLNGVQDGSLAFTGTMMTGLEKITIGHLSGSTASFVGVIDEVAIYTSLGAARFADHYAESLALGSSPWAAAVGALFPYAWYRHGEASGTTMVDSSGNGRDGSYVNAGFTYGVASLVPGDAETTAITTTGSAFFNATSLSYNRTNRTVFGTFKSTDVAGEIFYADANNALVLGTTTTTAKINATNIDLGVSPATFMDGTEHFVVLRVQAANVSLWVDGVSVASVSHSVASGTLTGFRTFDHLGTYDESGIFNTALSDAQIGDLWDAWRGGTVFLIGGALTLARLQVGGAATAEARITGTTSLARLGVSGGFSVEAQIEADVSLARLAVGGQLFAEVIVGRITGALSLSRLQVGGALSAEGLLTGAPAFQRLVVGGAFLAPTEVGGPVSLRRLQVAGGLIQKKRKQGTAVELGLYIGYGTVTFTPNLDLTILDPDLLQAPTQVTVTVGNARSYEENGNVMVPIQFLIDGVQVYEVAADSAGWLGETSVPVPVAQGAVGTHTLRATSAGRDFDEDTFTVELAPASTPGAVGADSAPVAIPAAEYATGKYHWVLQDLMPGGLGSWVMTPSPTSVSPMAVRKTYDAKHTTASSGRYHVWEAPRPPMDFMFAGYCPDEAFYNELVSYGDLNRRFWLIDHRNRAWKVAIVNCDLTPRRRQRNDDGTFNDWAHDYTVKGLVYDQEWQVPS